MMTSVNLAEKLSTFSEHFKPRTVGAFNGHDLMVVKVKGEFAWHSHETTDDFFLVLKGRLRIEMRTGSVELGPGELFVVPKGVEHRPVAIEEAAYPPDRAHRDAEHGRRDHRGSPRRDLRHRAPAA